jgi:hypothetical protein
VLISDQIQLAEDRERKKSLGLSARPSRPAFISYALNLMKITVQAAVLISSLKSLSAERNEMHITFCEIR